MTAPPVGAQLLVCQEEALCPQTKFLRTESFLCLSSLPSQQDGPLAGPSQGPDSLFRIFSHLVCICLGLSFVGTSNPS